MNLGINSIETTLMTLIELSQHDHSLQNRDNSFAYDPKIDKTFDRLS